MTMPHPIHIPYVYIHKPSYYNYVYIHMSIYLDRYR